MRVDHPKRRIEDSIQNHRQNIKRINETIWNNPELAWTEKTAHDTICDYFESLSREYEVTRHAYGIETSFLIQAAVKHDRIGANAGSKILFGQDVEAGQISDRSLSAPLIVFNAEYDALPNMKTSAGADPPKKSPAHACGHNLITSASVAAFIACWEALKDSQLPGIVRLLGTPAEESGGGKLRLLRAGAYLHTDACLMVHPGPLVSDPDLKACALTKSLASQKLIAEFEGVAAHAGIAPWDGRNALDALITSYVGITTLRQQLLPSQRINGIITNGGTAANIIPDHTRTEFSIRAQNKTGLEDLCQKVTRCFHGGATATGCSVKVDDRRAAYWDLIANKVLCKEYTQQMNNYDIRTVYELPGLSDSPGAATDQGNVSHFVPAIMAAFFIDSGGAVNHTPKFAEAAGTENAFDRAMGAAKGLAGLGFEVLTNTKFLQEVRDSHQKDIADKIDAHVARSGDNFQLTDQQIENLITESMPSLLPVLQGGGITRLQAIGALMATDTSFV
ncbi:hypothetical protein H072_7624 [Dactylellina haptotyla CBS 200.50]|uniref:Peptidase M20 dimerisation domain-containing protein n=1 Tax=Dactylellina haptotyla (strain CBS 200.50) TaxID=1284197 RepID=S8A6W8_DACHA|nr:hypothetical protein H072_7624 [Dactylellina haptotyla CBS 200.50]